MDKLTREQFIRHVRAALGHLYDANRLRESPLVDCFGLGQRFDASAALRCILTDAIATLRPKPDDPTAQRAWRLYESLFCCYIQQLSQQIVADQLAMSARQLRREQQAALELLADRLWEKYQPSAQTSGHDNEIQVADTPAGSTIAPELMWLKDSPPEQPANLGEDLAAVLELAQPLATQYQVQLRLNAPAALPELAMYSIALHQVLLNLLGVVIPRVPHSCVNIDVSLSQWEALIQLQAPCSPSAALGEMVAPAAPDACADDADSLNIARQLTLLSGGRLTLTDEPDQPFNARLTLPMLQQLPILVVDDNADALQLLQRYTTGTRYRVVGTQDPEQALALAERHSPQVIVLDVMMPQLDGWKILGRLRQHPATWHIPVVVCTILPQEKLALSLGANVFLKKPVTRQAFLAALDQQTVLRVTAPG